MSYTAKELLKLALNYDNLATRVLVVTAKKKEKKKSDSNNAKDSKKSNKKTPKKFFEELAEEADKAAKSGKISKKKKASEYYDDLLTKFAQGMVKDPANAKNLTDSRIQSINAINTKTLTPEQVKEYANGYLQQAYTDFQGNLITQEQYTQIIQAGQTKMQPPAQTNNVITIPTVEEFSPVARKPGGGSKYPFRKEVKEVQEYLMKAHPDFATALQAANGADGRFGPATQKAVMEHAGAGKRGGPTNPEEALTRCLEWARQTQTPKAAPRAPQPPAIDSSLQGRPER